MPHKHIIAANWKMNGLKDSIPVVQAIATGSRDYSAKVVLFPPATLLAAVAGAIQGTDVALGGQDCHHVDHGPYTGDISASMLKDCGASMVLLGHSERRHGHLEPCALVARKVGAALQAGLEPVICIGETLDQRQAGLTTQVLSRQLNDSLPDDLKGEAFQVSYEPVWAIGTGLIASDEQILEAFALIRAYLDKRFANGCDVQILYGGSVNPSNADHLMRLSGVGGALVGGASLTAETFLPIIAAAEPTVLERKYGGQ